MRDRISWSDPRLAAGAWVALLAAGVYLAFLPHVLVNSDEYAYAGQALALARGHILPVDGVGLPYPVLPAGQSLRYPLAWPALLALGRLVSVRGMWLVSLALHLAGGMAFARLLVRRGLPAWANAMWLFHPAAWIYARTVMSDVPATAVLLLAIDAWEERDRLTCAVALALLPAMRVANLLVLAGFGLAVAGEVRRRRVDAAVCAAAVVAALAFNLGVGRAVNGVWFGTLYGKQTTLLIGTSMLVENAALYLGGFLLLPPFPAVFAVARLRRLERWGLAAVPLFVFLLIYGYHDAGTNLLQTLVGGQRLALPAHAALLVATAGIWARAWPFSAHRLMIPAATAMAVLGALQMRKLEARYAPAVAAVRACEARVIGYNLGAGRVALSVDAERYVALDGRTDLPPMDVVILATRHESNRPGGTVVEASHPATVVSGTCQVVGVYEIHDLAGRCKDLGARCGR